MHQPMPSTELIAGAATLSDSELVARVLEGETGLFELLIRRHNPRVYRTIRAVVMDEDEVEDAMQQAWIHAYRALTAFAGRSSFSTWLTRIAVNEALGRRRSARRLVGLEAIGEHEEHARIDPVDTPEDGAAAAEVMSFLRTSVDRLPVEHRAVFMLREVEQLSVAETAEALGISQALVKVRLHRARARLRDLLSGAAGDAWRDAYPFLAPRCDRIVAGVFAVIG
jgi:RNA polymerase sigma-70 factor (ECF subfamily)